MNATKYLISRTGIQPQWPRDGQSLFFHPTAISMAVVRITTRPAFAVSAPMSLPKRFLDRGPQVPRSFDLMPDGRVLAVVDPAAVQATGSGSQMNVILNWFEELRARVPIQ